MIPKILAQLLLSLLTRVWVTQVGEILIQNLRGLFAEVTAFPSIEERGGDEEGAGVPGRTILLIRSEGATVSGAECCAATRPPRLGEEWKELGAGCWLGALGPTFLASRKRERRIMTASQVLCLSCIWMALELPVDDAHHALHLLGCHGAACVLLPQQVHDVGCELVARLQWGAPRLASRSPLALGIPLKGLLLHPLWLLLLTCSYFSSSEW